MRGSPQISAATTTSQVMPMPTAEPTTIVHATLAGPVAVAEVLGAR